MACIPDIRELCAFAFKLISLTKSSSFHPFSLLVCAFKDTGLAAPYFEPKKVSCLPGSYSIGVSLCVCKVFISF